MSDSDKTRQRLVNSIRKSKADAASKAGATGSGRAAPARTKSAPPTPKPGAATRSTPSTPADVRRTADAYQCGRRVWPD